MTLATAVLAFSGAVKNPSWVYPLAGCFPVIIFWIMDAKYLRLGRLFRHLFDAVRLGEYDPPRSTSKGVYSYISDNIEDWIEEAIEIRNNYQ